MPEEIKAEFLLDWKTIVALGVAVAIVLLGLGGCVYLASNHDAEILRAGGAVSTTNVVGVTNSVMR